MHGISVTNCLDAVLTWINAFWGCRECKATVGSGAFCPWRKRGDEGLIPSSDPPFPSWGGVRSEAQRVDSRAGLVVGVAFAA